MNRNKTQFYPNYAAFIDEIEKNGITAELLQKIIQRHRNNALYNRGLYERYEVMDGAVPIFNRKHRFKKEKKPINNKINNDFFGEIIDFKTGYFAGQPIAYGYNKGEESEETTGGEAAIDIATKALTDFTTRNNMYGVDMETTKLASICGYAGRLFYIDPDGDERVMPIPAFECIILSKTSISEPQYAIRYYPVYDINNNRTWQVEFYDDTDIYYFSGQLSKLNFDNKDAHLFDYCPLQGIENNKEMLGDAEKVLSLIDDYDKVLSDNSNEVEAFVHAYLIFENLRVDNKTIEEGQENGSFVFPSTGTQQGRAYFLTKNINDAFTEHHLDRVQNNIYRFSKTPNLADDTFGSASGVSLKFKLHGLETKCGMFEAKMMDAAQYMWKVLASSWVKKRISFDPLQVTMDFVRNFPLDLANEAQIATALKNIGLPDEIVYGQLSFIDDVDYVLELKEQEMEKIPSLRENLPEDEEETDEEAEAKKQKGDK